MDTGYGGKAPARVREQYALQPGEPLLALLGAIGVAREEVDAVILTHLHFDHAGGGTGVDAHGNVEPTFPNAKYFVQRAGWEDAAAQPPELAGTYFRKDFLPLEARNQAELLDGNAAVTPGVHTLLVGGHTRGGSSSASSSAAGARSASPTCVRRGGTCRPPGRRPTTSARDVRRVKPSVLQWAARKKVVAVFGHEEALPAATLGVDGRGVVTLDEPVPFPLRWEG